LIGPCAFPLSQAIGRGGAQRPPSALDARRRESQGWGWATLGRPRRNAGNRTSATPPSRGRKPSNCRQTIRCLSTSQSRLSGCCVVVSREYQSSSSGTRHDHRNLGQYRTIVLCVLCARTSPRVPHSSQDAVRREPPRGARLSDGVSVARAIVAGARFGPGDRSLGPETLSRDGRA
jgi:hypothetical protein